MRNAVDRRDVRKRAADWVGSLSPLGRGVG